MSVSKKIKNAVEHYAPDFLLGPLMRWRYRQMDREVAGSAADRFTRIYHTNNWRDTESKSGSGSNLSAAISVMRALPQLVRDLDAHTFIDIPCGDFHWMNHVDLGDCRYVGGDIVQPLIDENQRAYGSPMRRFVRIDLTADELPAGDLLMVRDCFIHLSFDMIRRALRNISGSPIKYLLTTTYPNKRRNWDIATGGFRPINLEASPFRLPPPMRAIPDDATEGAAGSDYSRNLALWRVCDLITT